MTRRPRNPFAGLLTHLSLLGSLGVLALSMAASGDGGGTGDGDEGGAGKGSGAGGEGGGTGAAGTGAGEGDGDGGKPAMLSMSQADLDRMIDKAVGKKASAKDAEFKAWLKAQELSEQDRAKVEKEAAEKERDEARQEALTARVETSIERAALAAGVTPGRVDRFLKLVDVNLDDLTTDGKPDSDAIAAAVKAALDDVPEFASGTDSDGKPNGKPKPSGASGGQHNGNGGGKTFTREQIAKMSAKEFAENEAAIDAAMKAGAVK